MGRLPLHKGRSALRQSSIDDGHSHQSLERIAILTRGSLLSRLVWLAVIVLAATACRSDEVAIPATTAATQVQAAGPSLTGVGFEVHQEPG